jgi:hypothetical protein
MVVMSFKENLKAKITLDALLRKLTSTIRETPGQRRLDKGRAQELLEMTDLEPKKVRDLDLYVRPLEGETMEVLVFDNELPIYHTTVADVALRKSPVWKEIFSKGKESLNRLYDDALARLDLSYTGDDLALLVEDARRGLEQKSLEQIQESFDLFFTLLHFQPVSLGILQDDIQRRTAGSPKLLSIPSFSMTKVSCWASKKEQSPHRAI